MVCAPRTISAPMITVITSNTCVMPPVGAGTAGMNISSSTVTAKLFSPNPAPSWPTVFGSSLLSQRSSWSLKGPRSTVRATDARPETEPLARERAVGGAPGSIGTPRPRGERDDDRPEDPRDHGHHVTQPATLDS